VSTLSLWGRWSSRRPLGVIPTVDLIWFCLPFLLLDMCEIFSIVRREISISMLGNCWDIGDFALRYSGASRCCPERKSSSSVKNLAPQKSSLGIDNFLWDICAFELLFLKINNVCFGATVARKEISWRLVISLTKGKQYLFSRLNHLQKPSTHINGVRQVGFVFHREYQKNTMFKRV